MPLYYILTGCYALFFNIVISVNLVYQTQAAGLNPLQLVLVGTVLEATVFVCEVPTGVVADVFSRRMSVVVGIFLTGVGFALIGALAQFETILLAQIVLGLGLTFISGAQQAWIADEVGVETAGHVYLRGAQVEQAARLIGIPIGIGLGVLRLNLPILVGGGLLVLLSLFLASTMPERGFRPAEQRRSWGTLTGTLFRGGRLVRGTPLLVTIFVIAAFYGWASEGFDRLWVAHFLDNLGFPALGHFEPVVWFGVVRMGSTVISIGAVEVVRRKVDPNSHNAVSRGLLLINACQIASLVLFAGAGNFYVGMLAFWSATSLSRMFDPLYIAWINQHVDSGVRATVISMSSQANALGQIGGGPLLGIIGTLGSLRAALYASGAVLSPVLLLYLRAMGQGQPAVAAAPDPMAARDP